MSERQERSGGRAVLRTKGARVTPLELFFDLIFVLALTQCTALMADDPTPAGVGRAMLVLAMLWWSWVGYAWLTSVVDPEEGPVRIVIFAAMAAFLVAALCVPDAFGSLGLLFAASYGVVRVSHIALFVIASGGDAGLRTAVTGLAVSTAAGVGLLTAAAFTDGVWQAALWMLAVVIDVGGPLVIDSSGWTLSPEHFAERHGLVLIVAFGESIVAIGVGAGAGIDAGAVVAAVLGVMVCAALWWAYFDVVALVAAQRLEEAAEGRERNTMARDSYSYLHFPMVAGIVLLALGLKKTLAHTDSPLGWVPAFALCGGVAAYLLALAAFRRRNTGSVNWLRLSVALVLLAAVPAVITVPALAALAGLALVLVALIGYESWHFAEARARIRAELRP